MQTQGNTDFDWDAYEADCPTQRRNFKRSKLDSIKDPEQKAFYQKLVDSVDSLKEPTIGDIVKGEIVEIGREYAHVDIGWREPAIVTISKESPQYLEKFAKGNDIEIIIKASKSLGGNKVIEGSHSEVVKHLKYQEIYESIGKPVAFAARVKELIHGGYFLDIEGIEVFMPGSLGGVNKLIDFESLIGKDIYVVPINYANDKNYIVVSHRDYLKSLIPQAIEEINPGDQLKGFVTGTTKFGVFCEFNECLTGLIHKSDLDEETEELFNTRNLKPGEDILFTVKEITKDQRIILTQKEFVPAVDPWEGIENRYTVPSEIKGRIRKKTKYGLFVELEPKIVGLLHVSDIPEYISETDLNEGDPIVVQLVKIDIENKKLFFKI